MTVNTVGATLVVFGATTVRKFGVTIVTMDFLVNNVLNYFESKGLSQENL